MDLMYGPDGVNDGAQRAGVLHWEAQRFALQFGAALHERVHDNVVSVHAGIPSSQNVGQRGHPAAGKHSGSDIVFACVKQKEAHSGFTLASLRLHSGFSQASLRLYLGFLRLPPGFT